MSTHGPVLGLVCCGAGGLDRLRDDFVRLAIDDGWTVAVTSTPTAARWLHDAGELEKLESLTGLPVRWEPRLPDEDSPHPRVDCYAAAPATANLVAKLALGIADNQALTQLCEAVGTQGLPVVVFPRVNAAHARQPAWDAHLAALRGAGVQLLYGPDVWPLFEPRQAPPDRDLPWETLLRTVNAALAR